jgi:uncharacterized protein (TIGR03435 family)
MASDAVRLTIGIGTLLALAAPGCVFGQRPQPGTQRYEVASIKRSAPGRSGYGCGYKSSPLQLTLEACPLDRLIVMAFGLGPHELQGGPAWISSESYTITAKSLRPANPVEQYGMLQPLFEDRFRLKWHWGKKDSPVYFVTASERGLKVSPTAPGSCVPFDEKSGPPPPPQPGKPPSCGLMLFPVIQDGKGLGIDATGTTMPRFLGGLRVFVGRPLINNTAFRKTFDVHIKFARDGSLAAGGLPDEASDTNDPSGLPNIFTALRGLGLNIKAGKAPVEVFVIDSVQRPSDN